MPRSPPDASPRPHFVTDFVTDEEDRFRTLRVTAPHSFPHSRDMYTHTHTHSIIPLRSPARHYLHLPARAIHARTASTIAPVTVQACINNDFAAYKRAFQLCAKEVEKGKAEQITNEMKDLQPFWGLRQARPPPPLLRRHTTTTAATAHHHCLEAVRPASPQPNARNRCNR